MYSIVQSRYHIVSVQPNTSQNKLKEMSSNKKGVIKTNIIAKSENNQDVLESEETRESEDEKEENKKNSQKNLPAKKRPMTVISDTPEKDQKQWQGRQKEYIKKAKILPGVIRHGSCPNRTLAYYYNYE